MEKFAAIDDRLIMTALTVAIIAAYIATRDAMLGEMMKYMLGATAGIMVARSQRTLALTGNESEIKKLLEKE